MPLLILLALLVAAPAGAQCCGDCDGDGQVDIADVIRAVNAALGNDCEAPRDACPYSFTSLTTQRRCAFNGRFNARCGGFLTAVAAGDGEVIAVALNTSPAVGFLAEVTSPTTATLFAWSVEPFDDTTPTSGTIELLDDGGNLLIQPDEPPFRYLGCEFLGFAGPFQEALGRQNFARVR